MDKKDKMQKEAELEAREEALEEEALPVEDAADASQAPKGPTQEELDRAAFERWGSHHHYIKGYMK